ncbi:MAG TPA: hypothetical protein VF610_03660 [Segetibacter sp.]|jgi:hypothetical protein
MQTTKKTARVLATIVTFAIIALTISACNGSESTTDEVQNDPVSMQALPTDSMPPIDTSADTRPEGTRTKVQ